MPIVDEFRFNDEFFLEDIERKRLKERFPNVYFAFYCEEVSTLFYNVDADAKAAKTGFQLFGVGCVGLAVLSIVTAAADPIFLLPAAKAAVVSEVVPKVVASLAAVAGLCSILIGALGLGIGPRKQNWQKKRLIGDRLRQWQAQYVCSHISEIIDAAGSEVRIAAYIRKRAEDFRTFKADHIDNVGCRLQEVIGEGHVVSANHKDACSGFNLWTDEALNQGANRSLNESLDGDLILKELFDAYDAIRFRSQEEYTKYILGKGPIRTHPRIQGYLLEKLGLSTIVTIVALHIIVIWGVLADVSALKSPIIHFLVVSIALISLGIRVLEDGLRPASHIARLQDYLEAVSESRLRFRRAETANDKRTEMNALEEASARELLSFMRTINASRYIL